MITLPYDKNSRYYVLWINPEPWKVGPVSYKRVGKDPSLEAYQEAVREALLQSNPEQLPGKVDVEFWFWHRRVRYQGAKKVVVKNEIDATNMQKATEDAIQGVLLGNDRNVVNITSHKMEDSEETDGKVVIRISPATNAGMLNLPDEVEEQIKAGPRVEDNTDWNKW